MINILKKLSKEGSNIPLSKIKTEAAKKGIKNKRKELQKLYQDGIIEFHNGLNQPYCRFL